MPSHLTRLVFRSIIANEPLLYRGCRQRAFRPQLLRLHSPRAFPQLQKRTFLDLLKPRRKLKPVEIPAGLETLSELYYAQKNGLRPPQPQVIADAIKSFFAQRKGPYEDFHIKRAHIGFKYLLENPREDGRPWFIAQELLAEIFKKMLHTRRRPATGGSEHVKFGKAILDECAKQFEDTLSEATASGISKLSQSTWIDLKVVRLLSLFGHATEARDLVERAFDFGSTGSRDQLEASSKAWGMMLSGMVREGNTDEMQTTAAVLDRLHIPVDTRMQLDLVTFFAERNKMEEAKFWYTHPVVGRHGDKEGVARYSGKTSAALLKACALSGDLSFGQELVTSLLKTAMPDKAVWDAIFIWSAAIGKGVDEVDRMMNVMVRRNVEARNKDPSVEFICPDIDTINALVEFSMSKQDPYSAERYAALGEKRGIMPDERTYSMQIQYRLFVKDIDGARATYFNLQGEFSGADQSVAAINQLIRALCESQQHHFDELMVMVDDLRERNAIFPPETIAALCVLHLRRGENFDAKDLLQEYAHQFSPDQRRIIQKGLLSFLLDRETSTADAWDTYQIIRNVFAETPRVDRLKVMNEFFARKRSDMACHVFFHMRNHVSQEHSANRDVYLTAFTGFARCADAESLELAHNQMKLDFNVDPDTRLRNALMLAYASTGENNKALSFWRQICESKEGPSYNSIAIAFRSCEGMHFGHGHARAIWKRLIEQDVEIDKNIWTAYMCAIARNHQHDEAQSMIETVEEEHSFKPDLDM
jgi:hypothetical protein